MIKLKEFFGNGNFGNGIKQPKQSEILNIIANLSPEFEITQFRFMTPKGKFEGRAKLSIDRHKVDFLRNRNSILPAFDAEVNFDAPKVYFEEELL